MHLGLKLDRRSSSIDLSRLSKGVALIMAMLIPVITSMTLYRHFTGDDTFIHLVFARNFAAGLGFAFNPGQPTYGASSPLWVLLLAAAGPAGLDYYWFARVLSLVFTITAVLAITLLAQKITGHFWVALAASLTVAIDPHFAKFASSGMETSLAITLIALSLFLHITETKAARWGAIASGLTLGVATLVRPECLLLFLACFADRVRLAPKAQRLRAAVSVSVAFLAIVIPWWLYAWLTFGQLLPDTASAKSANHFPSLPHVTQSMLTLAKLVASSYGVVFLVGCGSFLLLARKKSPDRHPGRLTIAAFLWIVLWLASNIVSGVDIVARYFLLVSPILIIFAYALLSRLPALYPRLTLGNLLPAVLLAVVLNAIVLTSLLVYPAAREFTNGFQAAYTEMGRWLATNTPPDSTIAVADIGAITYFGHRKTYDLGGLVTPEAIPYLWGNESRFVESVKPEYLVIRRMGARPDFDALGIRCAEETSVMTQSFSAAGSRTLGTPQFSTLYKLQWTENCS